MSERALQLKPLHAPYLVEAGYNRLFMDEPSTAAERFAQALQVGVSQDPWILNPEAGGCDTGVHDSWILNPAAGGCDTGPLDPKSRGWWVWHRSA